MHHACTHRQNTLLFDEFAMSAPLTGNDGAGPDMVSYQRPALFQSVARTKTQNGEPKTANWRTKMENQKPK